MKYLNNVIGFDWKDSTLLENISKNNLTTGECEEVFFNFPKKIVNSKDNQDSFYMIGLTDTGKKLALAFVIVHAHIKILAVQIIK